MFWDRIFIKYYIYFIFRQRRRKGEKEGEKYQRAIASCTSPTGDLAHHPGMCPDWELNLWPFGLQAGAQFTEPHQPRLKWNLNVCICVCVCITINEPPNVTSHHHQDTCFLSHLNSSDNWVCLHYGWLH